MQTRHHQHEVGNFVVGLSEKRRFQRYVNVVVIEIRFETIGYKTQKRKVVFYFQRFCVKKDCH